MEANINMQDVGAKKPSLLGMITSPGVQFERMKTSNAQFGVRFFVISFIRRQLLVSSLVAYLGLLNTPKLLSLIKDDTMVIITTGLTFGFGVRYWC